MKRKKRVICILLMFVLIFSSIPSNSLVPPIDVKAAPSYNAIAAINYAMTWGGSKRNPSYKQYDGDCANFVSQCLKAGGLDVFTTWAPTLKENLEKLGFTIIRNPSADQVEPGDIMFYDSTYTGEINHTTIITSKVNGVPRITGHTSDVLDGYYSSGAACSWKYGNITWAAILHNSSGAQGEMTTPSITTNKNCYNVGETVNITWNKTSSQSDFLQYWLIIRNIDTGEECFGGATGSNGDVEANSYQFTIPKEGRYTIDVYAVPYNDKEHRQKEAVKTVYTYGSIGEMTTPTIITDKIYYTVGDTVNITWNKTNSRSDFLQYWLLITNTDTGELLYGGPTGKDGDVDANAYQFVIPKAGNYMIDVYAVPYNDKEHRQKEAVLTISTKTILSNLTVKMADWDVSGVASNPVISGNEGNGKVTYSYASVGGEFSLIPPTKPGEYIVRAEVAETDRYCSGTATAYYKITDNNSKPLPVVKNTLSDLVLVMQNWSEGENAKSPILTGNYGNGKVTYTYAVVGTDKYSENVPVAAGTYVVKAVIGETDNYYGGTATCVFTISEKKAPVPAKPVAKKKQTISTSAASYTIAYGVKNAVIRAKSNGNGKLTYKTSNANVIVIDKSGKMIVKNTGKAIITITAGETSTYKSAVKKITITVYPKKQAVKSISSPKKTQVRVVFTKDVKASGYEVQIAADKRFVKGKKIYYIKTNKTYSKQFTRLVSGKIYYVKVRSYKVIDNKKVYGAFSTIKKIKVR